MIPVNKTEPREPKNKTEPPEPKNKIEPPEPKNKTDPPEPKKKRKTKNKKSEKNDFLYFNGKIFIESEGENPLRVRPPSPPPLDLLALPPNRPLHKSSLRNPNGGGIIRKTLLPKGPSVSTTRGTVYISETSETSSDDGNHAHAKKKRACPCAKHTRKAFRKRLKKFNEVSATNLKLRVGPETGMWDSWGVYYCTSRFGRHSELNSNYFALISLFVMSQGSMLNLIYYMNQHGGLAFLLVLAMAYISVGYPMYLFESMMGQYSGRKPLMMLRNMLPAMTGVGPALYLRTIVKAVNALGTFVYCAYLSFTLFFCRPTDNIIIYRFLETEQRTKKFELLLGFLDSGSEHSEKLYESWWLVAFAISLFILTAQTLKVHGEVSKVVVRVLLLAMGGYLIIGISRISEASSKSIVYIPLKLTFAPKWAALVSGRAWLDAIIFVIQSMELGTLVHPYLGSKNFFHYRSYRDGIYLVLIAFLWNVTAAVAALAWLGYVGVNRNQMEKARDHLFGHYGLIVVFMLKHLQAEMTQNVQADTLFFNAFFYSIVGISALCALIVYMIIIIDCSYPESGHFMFKMIIMICVVLFFGVVAPLFIIEEEGLRRMIFINFYVHKSWSAFFIIGSYFAAVAFGHEMGKFVHDFLNIIHIKGYQSKQHSYHVPRTLRYFVLAFLTLGMISYVFTRPHPHEGQTIWTGSSRFVGIVFSCTPLIIVVTVAIYYRAAEGPKSLIPHRDWFKNKHHTAVCFADFNSFKGIPALRDPETFGIMRPTRSNIYEERKQVTAKVHYLDHVRESQTSQ